MDKHNAETLAVQFAALIIKNDSTRIITNRHQAANEIADFIQTLSQRFENELTASRINLSD